MYYVCVCFMMLIGNITTINYYTLKGVHNMTTITIEQQLSYCNTVSTALEAIDATGYILESNEISSIDSESMYMVDHEHYVLGSELLDHILDNYHGVGDIEHIDGDANLSTDIVPLESYILDQNNVDETLSDAQYDIEEHIKSQGDSDFIYTHDYRQYVMSL